MITGDRMKARRKEIGVPVDQVAAALGVSVATVYRYENGDIEKVPGAVLEPLANVLYTTPQWLMGWTDDPSPFQLTISSNDPQIDSLIQTAKKLNAQGLERLNAYAEDLSDNPKYKKETPSTIDFGERKNAAAARSGDRVETAPVTPEEEEAALPPDYTGDI